MKWTLYQDDVEALSRLDCRSLSSREEDVVVYEDLRHYGLCEHVYSTDYRLTDAGRAVLRALFQTDADWWRSGAVAVSFGDQSYSNPVVSLC